MQKNVYALLAKHLDRLPIAFPSTGSGIELKILERWFTREEAEIALAMRGLPEPVPVIAGRLKMDPETLSPILYHMSTKGLIFRTLRGKEYLYNVVPLAEGMWEFHIRSMTPEDLSDLSAYFDHYMEKSWYGTGTSQHRIIPVMQSLSSEMEILPYEQAEEVIRSQSKIAVTQCICRKQSKMMGKECEHPLEVCMAFGTGAHFYIENGIGREISQEEAMKILREAMDAGLVLQPGNGQKAWSICMCCGCCCMLLKALKKMEKPAQVAHTSFYAQVVVDDCNACGLCEERCPMGAIKVEPVASVNRERCIGCGVCVGACPTEAIKLRQKDKQDRYVPPKDIVDMQIRIARERGIL